MEPSGLLSGVKAIKASRTTPFSDSWSWAVPVSSVCGFLFLNCQLNKLPLITISNLDTLAVATDKGNYLKKFKDVKLVLAVATELAKSAGRGSHAH